MLPSPTFAGRGALAESGRRGPMNVPRGGGLAGWRDNPPVGAVSRAEPRRTRSTSGAGGDWIASMDMTFAAYLAEAPTHEGGEVVPDQVHWLRYVEAVLEVIDEYVRDTGVSEHHARLQFAEFFVGEFLGDAWIQRHFRSYAGSTAKDHTLFKYRLWHLAACSSRSRATHGLSNSSTIYPIAVSRGLSSRLRWCTCSCTRPFGRIFVHRRALRVKIMTSTWAPNRCSSRLKSRRSRTRPPSLSRRCSRR